MYRKLKKISDLRRVLELNDYVLEYAPIIINDNIEEVTMIVKYRDGKQVACGRSVAKLQEDFAYQVGMLEAYRVFGEDRYV